MIYILDEETIELKNNVNYSENARNRIPKKGDSPLRPLLVANSSSDEEERSEPVVKRKRATCRPKRKLNGQRTASESKENNSGDGIYSSAVSECYKRIETGLHANSTERLSSDEDTIEDVNNNNNNVNEKRKPNAEEKLKRKSPRKSRSVQRSLTPFSPINVDGESVQMRDRSPSPPPSPATWAQNIVGRRRGPRRPKAVKDALADIQAIKRAMPMTHDYRHNVSLGDCSFDTSLVDDNAGEITVKVRSRSGIERFSMKSNETFLGVFEKMAAKEGASVEQCIMFRDDDNIEPYMTPASAKITVADIIGFCIRAELEEGDVDGGDVISGDDPGGIQLQVQAKGLKHKFKFNMLRSESLLKLMLEFARQHERELNSLKFYFDGELVKRGDTPHDLDMEELECLDAVFL